jgi:hypothetical protein
MVLNLVVSRIQRPVQVSYLIVPENLNTQITNGDQQNTQKVVATIRVSREKTLELIAGFLPQSVNGRYKNTLN